MHNAPTRLVYPCSLDIDTIYEIVQEGVDE